ncbi:MAG: ceramidase domain-containing protein [Gammaproteobacteria bacterium]|nr:ceramidase domain-containing protein [Gammaproteobacteria bacterium]
MQLVKQLSIPVIILAAIIGIIFVPAIPQDIHYHNFSDQRSLFGIANCFNVISNIPYLFIGVAGLYVLITRPLLAINQALRYIYMTFFAGVALVSFGSGYYHLSPSNDSLVWDRLPIAISLMAFFTIVLAEFINEQLARKLFLPLIATGLASVIYWYWSETQQQGDLRLYILVQFLPMILIPVILLMYPSRFDNRHYYWLIIACYGLAKLLELGDGAVFGGLGFVSGHSLKHLASALAPYLFYLYLSRRHTV